MAVLARASVDGSGVTFGSSVTSNVAGLWARPVTVTPGLMYTEPPDAKPVPPNR
jgi:hypothetical protein